MAFEFDLWIYKSPDEPADLSHGVAVATTTVAGEARVQSATVQKDNVLIDENGNEYRPAGPFFGSAGAASGDVHLVDDDGNAGPVRHIDFTLSDTTAPGLPGELGFAITREIPDDQVPPVE